MWDSVGKDFPEETPDPGTQQVVKELELPT